MKSMKREFVDALNLNLMDGNGKFLVAKEDRADRVDSFTQLDFRLFKKELRKEIKKSPLSLNSDVREQRR